MTVNNVDVFTLSDYIHHFAVTVNNIEVTVNTCTCTDVFTITTTKDQPSGICNNYSTVTD